MHEWLSKSSFNCVDVLWTRLCSWSIYSSG